MSGLQRKFSLQAYQLEVPEHASSKANKEYTMSSQKKGFKRYTTFETKELVRISITSYCEAKEFVRTSITSYCEPIYLHNLWDKGVGKN